MDIDHFYEKYGEKELIKQERELRQSTTDASQTSKDAKKPSVPKQKAKKGKKSANRYHEDEEDVAFDEIDLTNDAGEPGEYEINLSDNGDDRGLDSDRYSLDKSGSQVEYSTPLSQSQVSSSKDQFGGVSPSKPQQLLHASTTNPGKKASEA